MLFRVDFKSGSAVHSQLVSQIKAAAASGELQRGELLPTIGELAAQLRVNRNHIAKAYAELEGVGIIEAVPGNGYRLKEQHRPSSRGLFRTESPEAGHGVRRTAAQRLLGSGPHFIATVLYLLLVFTATLLFLQTEWTHGESSAVIVTLVIAGLFHPFRSEIVAAAERVLFPKRRLAPKMLSSLRTVLWSVQDLDSLLQRVADASENFTGIRPRVSCEHATLQPLVNQFPTLLAASGPVIARDDLLLPLFSQNELIAVLEFAGKGAFASEDYDFLASVGEQFAMAAGQLRSRNERLESEYALEIQRSLLPREIPEVSGFGIAGAWQPAKDVGGDYYDVFRLREDEIALVVADVSGKGAPAALLMSNVQATTKAFASSIATPAELCRRVNGAICQSISPGKFITFFYAVLNTQRRTLHYCNAGHNPPLLISQDGACAKLATGGTVLGLFAQAPYEEATVQLRPGDRLLMFTDGVTEAADSQEREFGDDRLFTVATSAAKTSAAELRDSIMQAVTHFCRGDFADDATLLTVIVDAVDARHEAAKAAKAH